jgi:hypothetical protein
MFDQISTYGKSDTARRPVRLSWWSILLFTPMMLAVVFAVYTAIGNWAIAKRQQTTYGTIVAHEPSNRNRYQYSFSTNGKSYSGWEAPTESPFAIGQRVLIYYDPTNPAQNALTDFAVFGNRNLIPIPFSLVVIALLPVLIAVNRRRHRANPD